ncbi:MAG: hypothetical protein Q7K20_13890 [Polaromonas sp.]|jgi:hypothetical protein|nr:hypothetical protein [Polaromonas sp.]
MATQQGTLFTVSKSNYFHASIVTAGFGAKQLLAMDRKNLRQLETNNCRHFLVHTMGYGSLVHSTAWSRTVLDLDTSKQPAALMSALSAISLRDPAYGL